MKPVRRVRYASEFIDGVAPIRSERLLAELDRRLEAIESLPELGSGNVRPSLTRRFGPGIRKFPVSPSVIVYRFAQREAGASGDEADERLDFLALVHGRSVR